MRPILQRPVLIATTIAVGAFLMAGCSADTPTVDIVTGGPPDADVVALAEGATDADIDRAVQDAVAQLPELAQQILDKSGVPGLAVAVVHGGETVYSGGFGVKTAGTEGAIDPGTVFQIASVSKPLSATAVAKAVTDGAITWDTAVVDELPNFSLADPYVTENATVGDYFSHRTGLYTGAGDDLEDIGYDRKYILDHLHLQPLAPFRSSYNYSNFGITVGAEAAAASLDTDWEDTVDKLVYEPIGMSSTSSRYADFIKQDDRATLHTLVDGKFQPLYERVTDPEAPAGGVSSNVEDLAKWMNVILAQGELAGQDYIDPAALLAATSAQKIKTHPSSPEQRTGSYGFGFNVGSGAGGRTSLGHSGAFILGAGTNFQMIPSLDVGIVTLTNGGPVGVAEALDVEFLDLVQYGTITRDWLSDFGTVFAPYYAPVGDLVDETAPADATGPADLTEYVGTYQSDYFGKLTVTDKGGTLVAALGPDGGYTVELQPWDADTFSFVPTGENAPAGSLSSATFERAGGDVSGVVLEFFDAQGLGNWTKAAS